MFFLTVCVYVKLLYGQVVKPKAVWEEGTVRGAQQGTVVQAVTETKGSLALHQFALRLTDMLTTNSIFVIIILTFFFVNSVVPRAIFFFTSFLFIVTSTDFGPNAKVL